MPKKYKKITIVTKDEAPKSDSFLAQGGICMLRDEQDYDSFFEDTMKAGHYENDRTSVEIMIRSSQDVMRDLLLYGTDFQKDENECWSAHTLIFRSSHLASHLDEIVHVILSFKYRENSNMD